MTPKRSEDPADRTAADRFSEEELEKLLLEAKRQGKPVSAVLREVVVELIDDIEAKAATQKPDD